jgi:uncharacterized protein YdcH (DUF465 family)
MNQLQRLEAIKRVSEELQRLHAEYDALNRAVTETRFEGSYDRYNYLQNKIAELVQERERLNHPET